jgi:hypothetical protein
MSKRAHFTVGQPIIWISRCSKSGEALFHVPGHVIKLTPKRITLLVRKADLSLCLRRVATKHLISGTHPPLPPLQLSQSLTHR